MRYSYQHKAFDYRTFSDKFYGKTRYVMSNLHEICYLIMIFTLISFGIAQFGLMAVVQKGYAYLGYASLIVLFIPMVFRIFRYRFQDI